MHPGDKGQTLGKIMWRLSFTLLCAAVSIQSAKAQQSAPQQGPPPPFVWPFVYTALPAPDAGAGTNGGISVPNGTILPVRLNISISTKSKARQAIIGRVMQDVPLPNGSKIREGSTVEGHIVEVIAGDSALGARISIQFDTLRSSHQTIPISTSLRAIAGPMEVVEAQTPQSGPGEGDDLEWMDTTQIGGDAVYGLGGPVTAAKNASLVVGRKVAGGVLSQVRAKEGTKCRGAVDGNENPQALWVFSSDACGTYGLAHVNIAHAGRTGPAGVIVLSSDNGTLKIAGGAAMLLRVNASSDQQAKTGLSD
jgi:hypothetical protein